MAVTGVPEIQDDHAERMADFAMDMMEEAANVPSPATGKPLKVGMYQCVLHGVKHCVCLLQCVHENTMLCSAKKSRSFPKKGSISETITPLSLIHI